MAGGQRLLVPGRSHGPAVGKKHKVTVDPTDLRFLERQVRGTQSPEESRSIKCIWGAWLGAGCSATLGLHYPWGTAACSQELPAHGPHC